MNHFRFAIMGAGKIANQFCGAVRLLPGCEVAAVSSKSLARAQAFAARNGIAQAYDSYEEMLEKVQPDGVYIATLPNTHFELTMLCLRHRAPVLCEKAMLRSAKEAETVFGYARQQNTFVMEALWSRFLPAVNKARHWLTDGRIGSPVYLDTAIGFIAPEGNDNRYLNPELGGGAAYDITVYAYELTTYMMKARPEIVSVSAVQGETGVDMTEHITLRFPQAIASLTTSFACPLKEGMVINGSKGRIVIPHPHYANEAFLYDSDSQLTEHYRDTETQNGFTYEIEEVMRCVREGQIESPVVPHQETTDCAKLFDLIMQAKQGV